MAMYMSEKGSESSAAGAHRTIPARTEAARHRSIRAAPRRATCRSDRPRLCPLRRGPAHGIGQRTQPSVDHQLVQPEHRPTQQHREPPRDRAEPPVRHDLHLRRRRQPHFHHRHSARPGRAAPADRQCFTYDALGQLVKAWSGATDSCTEPTDLDPTHATTGPDGDGYWQEYQFDVIGNRTQLLDKDPSNGSDLQLWHRHRGRQQEAAARARPGSEDH